MRRVFEYRSRGDQADAEGAQVIERRSFLHSRQQMMRVASNADRTLPRHQEFHQLRMAAMELDTVGDDSFEQVARFVGALISLFGEGDQKLSVTWLGQKLPLPLRARRTLRNFSARPPC